ncbi:MAG TPA: Gfo/Idh/MocA family oxidoreductase [Gemmatimonadaceae bacterium]|nr:Gfo/Idh/MocA family oxidoreductase [Gemmatimonadaceae bacterium]
MTAPIGVALIGYGLGGRSFHAPLIAVTEGLQLRAIATSNADRRRAATSEYPGVRIVADADALFAHDDDVDLVVISTPNRTHVALAREAIRAGKAVVIDKPMTPTAREARDLVAEAERAGVMLTTYQNRRWDGDFQTLLRLVRTGRLGDVFRFESHFERWRPALKGGWRERGDPVEAGGLLYDIGSHLIDQALFAFGPVTDVYAELDRRRPGAEVDDDVFVALTHAGGVRSHLWASLVVAQNAPRLRVLGSKAAYVKWTPDVQEEALRRGERPVDDTWGAEPEDHWGRVGTNDSWEPVPTDRGRYQDFYGGVVKAMRDGAPPPVDPRDAIATLDVIERALRR